MSDLSGIMNFVLFTGLASVGPIVALILVLARAQGRIRTVGVIGSMLLIISTVGGGLLSLFIARIRQQFDLAASMTSMLFIPSSVIGWAGTIVLGLAVVIRSSHQTPPLHPTVGQPPTPPYQR